MLKLNSWLYFKWRVWFESIYRCFPLSRSPSLSFSIFICPFFLLSLQAISNKDQHSISYTLSRVQMVVVEYTHDSNTDMFQVISLSFYQDLSLTTTSYFFWLFFSKWNNLVICTPVQFVLPQVYMTAVQDKNKKSLLVWAAQWLRDF